MTSLQVIYIHFIDVVVRNTGRTAYVNQWHVTSLHSCDYFLSTNKLVTDPYAGRAIPLLMIIVIVAVGLFAISVLVLVIAVVRYKIKTR